MKKRKKGKSKEKEEKHRKWKGKEWRKIQKGKEKLGMKKVGKVNMERDWERVWDGQRNMKPHRTEEGWGQREGSRGGKEVSQEFTLLMVKGSFNGKHISPKVK